MLSDVIAKNNDCEISDDYSAIWIFNHYFGGYFEFFTPELHLISKIASKSDSPTPKTRT